MVTPAGERYTQQYPSSLRTGSVDSRRNLKVFGRWLIASVVTVRHWQSLTDFLKNLHCCERNGAHFDNDPAVAACVREDAFDVEDVAEAIDRWRLRGPAKARKRFVE